MPSETTHRLPYALAAAENGRVLTTPDGARSIRINRGLGGLRISAIPVSTFTSYKGVVRTSSIECEVESASVGSNVSVFALPLSHVGVVVADEKGSLVVAPKELSILSLRRFREHTVRSGLNHGRPIEEVDPFLLIASEERKLGCVAVSFLDSADSDANTGSLSVIVGLHGFAFRELRTVVQSRAVKSLWVEATGMVLTTSQDDVVPGDIVLERGLTVVLALEQFQYQCATPN